jgi:hypothetical protein
VVVNQSARTPCHTGLRPELLTLLNVLVLTGRQRQDMVSQHSVVHLISSAQASTAQSHGRVMDASAC